MSWEVYRSTLRFPEGFSAFSLHAFFTFIDCRNNTGFVMLAFQAISIIYNQVRTNSNLCLLSLCTC